jgi:class 3 adenylate cyclase
MGEPDRNIPPAYHIITPTLKFSDIDGFTEIVLSVENQKNQQSIDEFFQGYVIMA